MAVSGVRSSWLASAVKRRSASTARSSRSSMPLTASESSWSSAGRSGTSTRRDSPPMPISRVAPTSRSSGRRMRSASERPPMAAAAAVTGIRISEIARKVRSARPSTSPVRAT
jgi:hypothetical protein